MAGYEIANTNWTPAGTGIACRWFSVAPPPPLQYISQGPVAQIGGAPGLSNLPMGAPPSWAANDVWFAIIYDPYGYQPTIPGWTTIGSSVGLQILYYRLGAFPSTTAYPVRGGASGIIMCYRGVNTINFVQNHSANNSNVPTVIGGTVNQPGYVIVLAGLGAGNLSGPYTGVSGSAGQPPWGGLHESINNSGTTFNGAYLGVYHAGHVGTPSSILQRILAGSGSALSATSWYTSWLYLTPYATPPVEETFFSVAHRQALIPSI